MEMETSGSISDAAGEAAAPIIEGWQWTLGAEDVTAAHIVAAREAAAHPPPFYPPESMAIKKALFGPAEAVVEALNGGGGEAAKFWASHRTAMHTCDLDFVPKPVRLSKLRIILVRGKEWFTMLQVTELYAFITWLAKEWEPDFRVDTTTLGRLIYPTHSSGVCSMHDLIEILRAVEADTQQELVTHPYVIQRLAKIPPELRAALKMLRPDVRTRVVTRMPPSTLIEDAFKLCVQAEAERYAKSGASMSVEKQQW